MKGLLGALTVAIGLGWCASTVGAAPLIYIAKLDGPSEVPPNTSPATGKGRVEIDLEARTLLVRFVFRELTGTLTAAHVHGPTAVPGTGAAGVMTAVPTFPGTPIGVTSGEFSGLFDLTQLSTFNPSFVTTAGGLDSAVLAFVTAVDEGRAYLNLHSTTYPGGEIRGFLAPIPLPAGAWLLVAALAGLGALRRRAA